jgi:hypothetical protein
MFGLCENYLRLIISGTDSSIEGHGQSGRLSDSEILGGLMHFDWGASGRREVRPDQKKAIISSSSVMKESYSGHRTLFVLVLGRTGHCL